MSTNPGPATAVLSLREISKRFGTVQAVQAVSMECMVGEIHAVVGENGSGKSTLLGVASGVLAADEGTVEIAGRQLKSALPSEAQRLGLGIAYQTFSEVPELSVAENLFLAAPSGERPAYREMNSWAAALLEQHGLEI